MIQTKLKPEIEKRANDAMVEIGNWLIDDVKLEKPPGSALHRLQSAMLNFDVVAPLHSLPMVGWNELQVSPTFVIEHDWGAAFRSAQDYDDGDYRLPFEFTCFEFKISGKRVCALVRETDEVGKVIGIAVETKTAGWALPQAGYKIIEGRWQPDLSVADVWTERISQLASLVISSVRAVCISLEASITKTDMIPAPQKLNKSRAKDGKVLLSDYHIVRLDRPHGPMHDGDGPTARKRLHFRRGHWRHLEEDRRTWVRWCLVGDPDLGFIEKEYRL